MQCGLPVLGKCLQGQLHQRGLSLKCPGTKPDRPEAARGGSEGACEWKCKHVYVRDMPRTLPLSLLRVTKGMMGGKGEG